MKNPKLGDYIQWKGELAKVIGEANSRTIIIQMLVESRCPYCNKSIGKNEFAVIPDSPAFQKNAEPLQTMKIT